MVSSDWGCETQDKIALGENRDQGAEDYTLLRNFIYSGYGEAGGPPKETSKQEPEELGRSKRSVSSWKPERQFEE